MKSFLCFYLFLMSILVYERSLLPVQQVEMSCKLRTMLFSALSESLSSIHVDQAPCQDIALWLV